MSTVTERLNARKADLVRAEEEIRFWRGQSKAHARAAKRARAACYDLALDSLREATLRPTHARRPAVVGSMP